MAAKTIRQKVDGEKDIHAMPKNSSTDCMYKGENIFTIKTTGSHHLSCDQINIINSRQPDFMCHLM